MLFMVWSDTGSELQAYCVLDSFSAQARLGIYADGHLLTTMAPNATNEHMKARHETGHVGFTIDDSIIGGLADMHELELREASSGLLVYRRSQRSHVQQAVFRLETQLVPLKALDAALRDHFLFWYDSIDRYAAETTRQILAFHSFKSLYSSGRILCQNFDHYLWDSQKVIMMMQDPYVELASRLLAFKTYSGQALSAILSERDQGIFEPILDVVEDLQTFEPKELKSVLGRADRQVLGLLSNPVVRQLTTTLPDEVLLRNNVAPALRRISDFEIVGLKEQAQDFSAALAEMLDIAPVALRASGGEEHRIAEHLRAAPFIETLIEQDLELYGYIQAAYAAV